MKIKRQKPRSPVPNAFGIGTRMSENTLYSVQSTKFMNNQGRCLFSSDETYIYAQGNAFWMPDHVRHDGIAGFINRHYLISFNDSYAAFTVFSISLSVCAREMKPASNCEGARFTPLLSMPEKNLENLDVSDVFAVL